MIGIKYLALIGTGINNNPNEALGNNIPNATSKPIIAPEAPTAGTAKESYNSWAVSLGMTSLKLPVLRMFFMSSALKPKAIMASLALLK